MQDQVRQGLRPPSNATSDPGSGSDYDNLRVVEARRKTGMPKRFSSALLASIGATKYMRIRSGQEHRFIAVWVVVVAGRVLVRSWNDEPDGWFRAFLEEPRGEIEIDGRAVKVRAAKIRAATLNEAGTLAYANKYTTKANAKYVKGFATAKRMETTLELVPF